MTYVFERQTEAERQARKQAIDLKNKRLGMTIFQVSWIMVFVSLIVVNWQLRYQYQTWPPQGVERLSPIIPTIATLALIVSTIFARNGLVALLGDNHASFISNWRNSIGLGAVFMGIIAFEFLTIPATALATQYGLTFRLMTGFHFTHALVIGGMMLYILRNATQYHADNFWTVEGTTKLWYFVTIAWILFYVVLYWIQ